MKITFNGNPLTLNESQLSIGDVFPSKDIINNDLSNLDITKESGAKIVITVPSVDTAVCDQEIKRFNDEVSKLKNITCYTISMDLPFAQARWCGVSNISNVKVLSDYKTRELSKSIGVFIEELALTTRASFVLDANNKVVFAEYLSEITNHPSYDKILDAAKNI
ncbi:MAG: thiol peroxidase [Oscillospiraceae bacterium]|nr:thiol peroxidase [Oscillospiraceae bacterium]